MTEHKKRQPNRSIGIVILFVTALLLAMLLQYDVHLSELMQVKEGNAILRAFLRLVLENPWTYVTAVGIAAIGFLLYQFPKIRLFLFQYRYAFAGAAFVLCVVLGISGSSAGYWCDLYGIEDKNLLLGYSRIIRSDEFCVATPSYFAQKMHGGADAFLYDSDVINGYSSDFFMGLRQPIAHMLTIFRPFLLGYLFLPANQALAFFWCGKCILLICVSFEFGRLLTKGNKLLSLCYALLIGFSPAVQWWFSTSIADLLIYAQLSILAFRFFLTEKKFWKRILLLLGIYGCMGAFILCLYPAWQVPMVYIILALIIWTILEYRKESKLCRLDVVAIAIGAIAMVGAFVYVYLHSKETILAILGTVYPGERAEVGGGEGAMLFTYGVNVFFSLFNKGFGVNICESATMLDFFPLCLIPPVIYLIYSKKKDLLCILLLVVDLILVIWVTVGFPEFLARISFLSNSQPARTKVVLGALNCMLLVRGLSLSKDVCVPKKYIRYYGIVSVLICMGGALALAFGATVKDYEGYLPLPVFLAMLTGIYIVLGFTVCALFLSQKNRNWTLAALGLVLILSVAFGGLVNPVRRSVDSVYDIPWVQDITAEAAKDDHQGIWVVENTDAPAVPNSDIALWGGAKTLNTTAIVPNLSLWHQLDPNASYEDVYNRYAHINVILKKEGAAVFELNSEDTFTVTLTLEDLKQLGVNYITCLHPVEGTEAVRLTRTNHTEGIYIYRLEE